MTEEQIRERLAKNLTYYRKQKGLTQLELSGIINYSDKSISKWERGEGVPDVIVLTQLAELFGITIDDLLAEHTRRRMAGKTQKLLITLLSVGLVWFTATFCFIVCKIALPKAPFVWMAFIAAIPISAIVLIVFTHLWSNLIFQFLSVSLLLWGGAITFHLPLKGEYISLIYVLAGVFQVLVLLWYLLLYFRRKSGRPKRRRKNQKAEAKSIPEEAQAEQG